MDHGLTFRQAKLMDKNPLAAARIRLRYLHEEVDWLLTFDEPVAHYWAAEALEEICYLIKRAYRQIPNDKLDVDDGRIYQAMQYPVEQLIHFDNGKAYAWCHEDHHASLTLWRKANKVKCWPCNKTFGPIDIVMQTQNMTFLDAVRFLT